MIVSLAEAKEWLTVDYDDKDNDIQLLCDSAEAYLFNATGITFDNTNPLAKLYCRVLITDWFDNNGLMTDKVSEKARFSLQSIMLQLQYSYTVDTTTTTGV
ncbi:phage gp6-like head-tail connector protein [Clostridium autoethanogenum]|uniref:Phage gp6-like head-tail connector protein n=1 Tax=Clostridium autoethanogenum TaxID=84023 RepID=A0A3M0SW88_9CLOT|nr:head-tail connector protein [Clostridium autoethanogenum]RMD02743.1 phage gp6-like head-tail connector protein [Clostridium autoethanogenum]